MDKEEALQIYKKYNYNVVEIIGEDQCLKE